MKNPVPKSQSPMVMHDAIETKNNTNNVVMQGKDTLTSFVKYSEKNKSSEKEPRKTNTIRDGENEKTRQLPLRRKSHNSYKPPTMLNGTMSPENTNQHSKSLDGDQWSFSEGDLEAIIAPTKSQRILMTQVSSLDLEDPAFGDFSNGKVSRKDDDSSTAPGMNVQGEYLKQWMSNESNHHHTDADESSDDSYTPQPAPSSRRNAEEVNSGPTGCSVPRQPPPPPPPPGTGTGTDGSHKQNHLSFSYVPPRGSFSHRKPLPRIANSPNRPTSTCGRSSPSRGGPFRSEVSASPPDPFVPPPGSFIHRTPTITNTTTTRRKTLPQYNHSLKEEESIDDDRNNDRHQSDPLLTSSPFMDSNTSLEYDDEVNRELSTHGVFK
jgi:hypothetical protein